MSVKETTFKIPKEAFNEIYLPLIDNKSRYLVLYGGAGSGKSYFIAERYIVKMLKAKKFNLLVIRNTATSNKNSTFALFKQVINKWKLEKFFKINQSELRITCVLNKHEIIFAGLDDVEKLKSVTFSNGELTDIWVEEASEVEESDFNQLDVRLRGKGIEAQIVVSFNPININHWLKKRFFDINKDNATVLKTTYKDNNFLDVAYKQLLESYKETDPYYYDVYCLGNWGVFGDTIFNKQKVSERINQVKEPIKRGFFVCTKVVSTDSHGEPVVKIDNYTWIDDEKGYIKIYEDVKPNYPYVIGGDTAGEGSDFFIGQVLDNTTGNQVAVLRQQFDEDLYAEQMYCLGMYYNKALIGIENNFTMSPIKNLSRWDYPRQYVTKDIDTFTQRPKNTYGFRTTSATRPVILADLVKIVRENTELINDLDTLNEMLTFVRNEKGRPEAMSGEHDDLIMSLAIAHIIRPQQDYLAKDEPIKPHYNFEFEKPKPNPLGKGERVRVI